MEVENTRTKVDLLKALKNKINNNLSYDETAHELLNIYKLSEKLNDGFNGLTATALILLFYISGDYQEANKRRSKIKGLKLITSNEEFSMLFGIGKRFSKDPFCDLYGNIAFFQRTNSLEISTIATCLLKTYERAQAIYLSKFYSQMKLSTLKKFLGSYIKEDKVVEYINKNGWIQKDDYLILSPLPENFDSYQLKEDLSFFNKMSVNLENIAKANSSIKPVDL